MAERHRVYRLAAEAGNEWLAGWLQDQTASAALQAHVMCLLTLQQEAHGKVTDHRALVGLQDMAGRLAGTLRWLGSSFLCGTHL